MSRSFISQKLPSCFIGPYTLDHYVCVTKMKSELNYIFGLFNCSPCQVMELKGQMIHVPESCSVMFLGSPRVDKLEELMGRGLHLSDIPIHDATRDVILVGEQAKAQDGLKKRMDKLKVKRFILQQGD